MAIFGMKARDDNGREYLRTVSSRLERVPVNMILDAGSKQKGDVWHFRIEPRLPKMYWLGIGIATFLFIFGWLKWWVLLLLAPLLAWWAFWHPGVYYLSMLWGFNKKYGYGGGIEYVRRADAERALLPGRDA